MSLHMKNSEYMLQTLSEDSFYELLKFAIMLLLFFFHISLPSVIDFTRVQRCDDIFHRASLLYESTHYTNLEINLYSCIPPHRKNKYGSQILSFVTAVIVPFFWIIAVSVCKLLKCTRLHLLTKALLVSFPRHEYQALIWIF